MCQSHFAFWAIILACLFIISIISDHTLGQIIMHKNKIPRPSWDDAPEWANYLTQDSSGMWIWWERKPTTATFGAWENKPLLKDIVTPFSQRAIVHVENWQYAIEVRPNVH